MSPHKVQVPAKITNEIKANDSIDKEKQKKA
jgi:hypothetical protein